MEKDDFGNSNILHDSEESRVLHAALDSFR